MKAKRGTAFFLILTIIFSLFCTNAVTVSAYEETPKESGSNIVLHAGERLYVKFGDFMGVSDLKHVTVKDKGYITLNVFDNSMALIYHGESGTSHTANPDEKYPNGIPGEYLLEISVYYGSADVSIVYQIVSCAVQHETCEKYETYLRAEQALNSNVQLTKYYTIVRDNNNNELEGAEIVSRDYSGNVFRHSTDRYGLSRIDIDPETLSDVEVTKDGYYPVRKYSPQGGQNVRDSYVLYPDIPENLYKLSYADLHTPLGKVMNTVIEEYTLNKANTISDTFSLVCQPFDGENLRYRLFQNNRLATESDSNVIDVPYSAVLAGTGFEIEVSDGTGFCSRTPISLRVTDEQIALDQTYVLSKTDMDSGFDLGEYNFSGMTPELNLFSDSIPLKLSYEDGEVKVSLGGDFDEVNDLLDTLDENIDSLLGFDPTEIADALDDFDELQDMKGMKQRGSNDFKISVAGSAEIDASEITIDKDGSVSIPMEIAIIITAVYEHHHQFIVGWMPIVVDLEITGELATRLECAIKLNENGLIVSNEGVLMDFTLGLDLFVGIGITGFAAAGIYGQASLKNEFVFIAGENKNTEAGLEKTEFSGALGMRAYVGPFSTGDIVICSTDEDNPPVLYDRHGKNTNSVGTAYNGLFDMSSFRVDDLSYLAKESAWLGGAATGDNAVGAASDKIHPLLRGTYKNADPSSVSDGKNALLAFVSADDTEDPLNAPKIKFSVYNNEEDIWTEPALVDGGDVAEYSPKLFCVNGKIWLAYNKLAKRFDEGASAEDYFRSYELYAAAYDPDKNCFETPLKVSEAQTLNRNPVIFDKDGKTMAAWVSSEDGNPFAAGDNRLMIAAIDCENAAQPAVLAAAENTVCDMTVSDGVLHLIADKDGNLATIDDRSLMSFNTGEGTLSEDCNAPATQLVTVPVSEGAQKLLYVAEGKVCDFMTQEPIFDAAYNVESVSAAENALYFTASENGKSNVYYAEYLPEANCWTTPVDISYQGDYIEKLSVFTIDGSNILTMLSKEVAISDDSINDVCSLCSMEDTPFTDLEVIKVKLDKQRLNEGRTVPVEVTVRNNSNRTVYDVPIYTGFGGSLMLGTATVPKLLAGESTTVVIDTMLRTAFPRDIIANVKAANDIFPDNDRYSVRTCYADLALDVTAAQVGGNKKIEFEVTNRSAVKTKFYIEKTNEPLADEEKVFYDIGAYETVTVFGDYDETAEGRVEYRVVCNDEEKILRNNKDAFFFPSAAAVMIGDVNGDGNISISDATLVQQAVAEFVELTDVQKTAGDVNCNGMIDVNDATLIQQYVAEFIDSFD